MKILKEVQVEIGSITTNLFVRQKLDEDRVMLFMELIASKSQLPLIEVTEDFNTVDGRHRLEAYVLSDITHVRVQVLRFDSEAEMIGYAFRKNTGGAKPPTTDDIEHTTKLLLERGCKDRTIAEELNLPLVMIKKYIQTVKDRLSRAKMQRAVSAVTEGGLTVQKAADQYDVDVESLKVSLSGKRRKQKTNGVTELQRAITQNSKSFSQIKASAMKKLIDQYDDGDVTERQIREIIEHLKEIDNRATRNLRQWEQRFEAKFEDAKNARNLGKVAQ